MICPGCHPGCDGVEHDGCQRSVVEIVGTSRTQMPSRNYFDEDGELHGHNPNTVRTLYRCSNGHRFEERSCWQCGACGWKAFEAKIMIIGPGNDAA